MKYPYIPSRKFINTFVYEKLPIYPNAHLNGIFCAAILELFTKRKHYSTYGL